MSKNTIVAIVGMCGSGKSVATDIFKEAGWKSVYFGGVTMKELERRGLDRNEKNERSIREALRAEYGLAAFAVLLLPEIREAYAQGSVILDGLYSWSEYSYLKEHLDADIKLLAIVTDRSVRYARLANRDIRPLTAEEAKTRDYSEIENLEKGGPISYADHFITNNADRQTFEAAVRAYLDTINQS